jgi:RsiW-degrading membrane proteinase PrsW (M82 family)
MKDKSDYFDVSKEPNVFEGAFVPDPTEQNVKPLDGHQDEISSVRDIVYNEPAITGKLEQARLGEWLEHKRLQCSIGGSLLVTMLAAIAAGPFAIIGVFLSGSQTTFQLVYMVLFGPVIEELLKQSGMIYLLEKKPYRLFSAWQFITAAVISSLIFSAVENFLYIKLYSNLEHLSNPQGYILFRWTICTLLHVTCSMIASIGLINVWQKQLADGRAADLATAFRYFAAAMGIHGLYNLGVVLINPQF